MQPKSYQLHLLISTNLIEVMLRSLPKKFLPQDKQIALPALNHEEPIVFISQIIYIRAKGNHSIVYYQTIDGNSLKHEAPRNIGVFEEVLHDYGIIRVHHSFLLNFKAVVFINFTEHQIRLLNGVQLFYTDTYQSYIKHLFINLRKH
jgi:DNA-binding LytR/AlgR family response regulator